MSVWGIILVVLGHSGFEEPIIRERLAFLHSWIYSFHMPLFFMISGYLFSFTNKDFISINPTKFLTKKIQRLLIPYTVLGIILYIIKLAFSGLSHAERTFSVGAFFKMFISPGCADSTMGYLWYLLSLFMIFVIVITMIRLRCNLKSTSLCIALFATFVCADSILPKIEWLNISSAVHYMPYFLIGILLCNNNKLSTLINRIGGGNLLISTILSVLIVACRLEFPFKIGAIVSAIVGIWMSISLCNVVLRINRFGDYLISFSKYTYSIYLFSWFGQYAAKIIIINILHLHWSFCVMAMFICGLLLPIIVDRIVDRIAKLQNCRALHLIIGY